MSFRIIKKRVLNGFAINYSYKDLIHYLRFQIEDLKSLNNMCKIDIKKMKYNVIVISLPFRLDKREHIKSHFKTLNIPFTFFNAIHGKTEKHKLERSTNFSNRSVKYLSAGAKGCIASSIKVLEAFSKESHDAIFMFQDDIILSMDIEEIKERLSNVPNDFDIIYLGSGSYKSRINIRSFNQKVGIPFSIRKGAYGLVISKKGCDKILRNAKIINITCGGFDTLLGIFTMRKILTAYHLIPPVCEVDFSFTSNIYNSSKPFKKIHKFDKYEHRTSIVNIN